MQIKTIQKNVQKKMDEWIASINDESLRDIVKKHLLVSGGSIASMLLNEQVNDYDVYIQNMDTLFKLAEYYAKPQGIPVLDGRRKEEYIDKLKKDYDTEEEEEIYNSWCICVRNLHETQVKLFLSKHGGGLRINDEKPITEIHYEPLFFSPNAISLSNDIQIVLRFSGSPEDIHSTFDFVHATNYFTYKDGLVRNLPAIESILTKQLKYQGSKYPLTSIIRMKKFIKRGFNISAGEILKIMYQISELNLNDPDVLEEQLIGVDVAYFGKIIEILRSVSAKDDTFCLTKEYLNTLIDRVFDAADESL